jgi:polyisoprenoid-binding protein YceI
MNQAMIGFADAGAVLCATVLAALAAAPAAGLEATLLGQGRLSFTATQMDVPLGGEFHKFVADVHFDPAAPAKAKVDIEVDLDSVDTGSSDGDKLLKGPGFFDVARFPRASFVATDVTSSAPGKYVARGRLTLKGRSAPLNVPFATRSDSVGTWIQGALPISRLAYGVGDGEWSDTGTLSDEVRVSFSIHLRR